MLGPSEIDPLPAVILKMLERPKHAPAPATSIATANVPATEKIKRATAYLAAIPGATQGSRGSDQTYAAAQALTVGFDLSDNEAYALMASEYNPRCSPPWSEKELWHKIKSAEKNSRKPRGWLLAKRTPPPVSSGNAAPSNGADWQSQLRFTAEENPKLKKTAQNVEVVLRNDPRWRGVIAKNTFSELIVVRSNPPLDRFLGASVEWRDIDDTLVQGWFEREYDVTISVDAISRGVQAAAQAAAFHPVRDYLNSLKWDGVSRVNEWLSKVFDVENNAYSVAVGSKWAISAVARIFEPGCKVDCILVLEGDQGALKSTAAITLCGPQEWFIDELEEPGTKDAAAQLDGRWIVELAELNALNRAEWNTIKAFASRQVDRYRPAYGHHVINKPRQSVFVGTVNPNGQGYLRDETGNRRFWPVTCQRSGNIQWLRENRDQFWAETVVRYRAGEKWFLDNEGLRVDAAREQLARVQREAWQEKLEHWLVGKDSTTVAEILERFFNLPTEKWDQTIQTRAARALSIAGWEKWRMPKQLDGSRPWSYRKKNADQLVLL